MSLVKLLGAVDGIISIKNHLKGAFGFNRFLDLAFLFIEDIWHFVQEGSGSILGYTYSQTLELSPSDNYLVYLWPNLWCNNSKSIFFLAGNFFVLETSFISLKNECFPCAICGNVTAFFSFALNYTVQNPFWNKQVCPKFINVMIENNLSHKSGINSTLCNVAIEASLLSSHISS